jgi:hypothetical protein
MKSFFSYVSQSPLCYLLNIIVCFLFFKVSFSKVPHSILEMSLLMFFLILNFLFLIVALIKR